MQNVKFATYFKAKIDTMNKSEIKEFFDLLIKEMYSQDPDGVIWGYGKVLNYKDMPERKQVSKKMLTFKNYKFDDVNKVLALMFEVDAVALESAYLKALIDADY